MSAAEIVAAILVGIILLLCAIGIGAFRHLGNDVGFWGSILGAIVGGAIGIVGQLFTIREARKQRQAEGEQKQLSLATSFLFKLIKIYSDLESLGRYFTNCLEEEPRRRRLKGELWMLFKPLASIPEPIVFSPDEMTLLLSISEDSLFDKCMMLDDDHNLLLRSIKRLCDQRNSLISQFEPDNVQDDIHFLYTEPSPRQRGDMNALNSLIERLRRSLSADQTRSGDAIIEATALFRRRLGLTISVSIKDKQS